MSIHYPLDTALVTEWPGDRGGGNWHYGTDFKVPVGTPLVAAVDGVIVFAGGDGASGELYAGSDIWANGEALVIDIRRRDGLIVRYAHLSQIDVHVGQTVKTGQHIGLSGNTGWTTGPHLHWELRWDRAWSGGAWTDPRRLGTRPIGEIAMTPAQEKKLDRALAAIEKLPVRILDESVPRTGTDAKGKPRTGRASLRGLLSSWEHQVGVTRRLIEAIHLKIVGK